MSCPLCGRAVGVLICDGVIECTAPRPIPTGAHPSGIHGPTVRLVPCGVWYQVRRTSSGAVCRFCSVEAVFSCTVCRAPLSLGCSVFRGGDALCAEDARRHDEAVAQAASDRSTELREFATSLDMASKNVVKLRPDLRVQHEIHRWSPQTNSSGGGYLPARMRDFRVGSQCPEHGGRCLVTARYPTGWWPPTPKWVTCQAPAWVVHQPIDVPEGRLRSVLLLMADGRLHIAATSQQRPSTVNRKDNSTVVTAENVGRLTSAPLHDVISGLRELAARKN
jgi:hypothetical protein